MMEQGRTTAEGETARSLGRLEANVAAIESRLERLDVSAAARMSVIELKLDGVTNALAQSMGAMKLVHWAGGALFAALGYFANSIMRELR
ncbi:MAG: hypothetical protein KGJ41_02655 [Rhodospirillales bacterium]|nr:hypothetical protein [Rhodospirillales bacterium]MDE2575533.1 hypothetical protein [Rhodospirillales bacterium]